MRLRLDVELPEYQERPTEEDIGQRVREEIDYLVDQVELGRNMERCLCRLKHLYRLLKKGLPKRWKQEFARRIENVLLMHSPDREWQREALAPKEDSSHG